MHPAFAKFCLFFPVVWLRGEKVGRYLRRYQKSQWDAPRIVRERQHARFLQLVTFAKDNVPHYARTLADIDLNGLAEISELEFVNKKDLIENKSNFVARRRFRHSVKTTGGSTWEPMTLYKDSEAMAMERAALWRGYSWAGIDIGDPQGRFWGMPQGGNARMEAKLVDFINNRHRIYAFDFDESTFMAHYQALSAFQPRYLYGYVSLIRLFGEFLAENKLVVPPSLHSIITTAEELTEEARHSLESSFGVKVYNEYGSGEIGTIAHECPLGQLHISAENVLVEVIDARGNPCEPGELGELVVTELNNHMFPLIRYRIGDMGRIATDACECGRGLPVLSGVYGRVYDIIQTPAGRNFHPAYFSYVFKELTQHGVDVRQFQVHQSSLSTLHIKLIPVCELSEQAINRLRQRIQKDMGFEMTIEINLVEKIPRERSGKFRAVKGLQLKAPFQ